MANAVVDTGHGASVSFGDSTYSFNWTSINMGSKREATFRRHTLVQLAL
jgi:hypothetical protein